MRSHGEAAARTRVGRRVHVHGRARAGGETAYAAREGLRAISCERVRASVLRVHILGVGDTRAHLVGRQRTISADHPFFVSVSPGLRPPSSGALFGTMSHHKNTAHVKVTLECRSLVRHPTS